MVKSNGGLSGAFVYVLLFCSTQATDAILAASTIKVVREVVGVDGSLYSSDGSLASGNPHGLSSLPEWCQLETNRSIIMSHPMSIDSADRFYTIGSLSLEAIAMTVDYINSARCGVSIDGKNYSITLQTLGDSSDGETHAAIGRYLVDRTDVFLSGYSSDLTEQLIPVIQDAQKVMIAGGSSKTELFVDNEFAFTLLPQGVLYADQALLGLTNLGAKTLAVIEETGATCLTSLTILAKKYNMSTPTTFLVPADASTEELIPVATNLSQVDPDVVYACFYQDSCRKWIRAMRTLGWNPKAQIFSLCIGSSELEAAGTDIAYMMGVQSWTRYLADIPDEVTGWTPEVFAKLFEATTFQNATYQHTAAATTVSAYVQAIERAQSLDNDVIRQELANGTFTTMYGEVFFDENGQNEALSVVLQYNPEVELNVVYPASKATTEGGILYPMPSWDNRDCVYSSSCTKTGGVCMKSGECDCADGSPSESASTLKIVGIGVGTSAFCKEIPVEDFSYVSDGLQVIGIVLVCLQGFLSTIFTAWTVYNRNMTIVKASQPFFLIIVAFGCFVLCSSIIPSSIQGEYRTQRDPVTGQVLPDTINEDIGRADAACMAAPWLAGIGFAIVFSALFAKIWRVKKLLKNAERFKRKTVEIRNVIFIMIGMLAVETALLLSWQLIDPLQWQRNALLVDADNFTLQSVGKCQSETNSLWFIVPLGIFNGGCLLYALWLCYTTRNVSDDFAEGKWITISIICIFQILLLAVPVLIIAEDDRSASFFVRAMIVFLLSSSVSIFIFVPKLCRVWATRKQPQTSNLLNVRQSSLRPGLNRQRQSFDNGELKQAEVFNDRYSYFNDKPASNDSDESAGKSAPSTLSSDQSMKVIGRKELKNFWGGLPQDHGLGVGEGTVAESSKALPVAIKEDMPRSAWAALDFTAMVSSPTDQADASNRDAVPRTTTSSGLRMESIIEEPEDLDP